MKDSGSPQPADDGAAFQTLVRRVLAPQIPDVPARQDLQLLVRQLPPHLPVDLPLPDNVDVVGSVVRGQLSTEIVLDAQQSAEQVFAFYQQRLTAMGWREWQHPQRAGGFIPSVGLTGIRFQRGSLEPSLQVSTYPLLNGLTDVRLFLQSHRGLANAVRPSRSVSEFASTSTSITVPPRSVSGSTTQLAGHLPSSPLPRLEAPPSAWQSGSGGGGSSDSFYSTATLITDLNSLTLVGHYGTQMEGAGWIRQSQGQSGPVTWSTWTLDQQGQSWHGLLQTMELPEMPQRRVVYVRADYSP
ncbi:MAG: hypothetical protein JOZ78_13080 [Chroococcidiopsidaceae cyanobacterium CP_BM_ER_R8_30]|nr:hypothetical protein [Chroococcidiopsidaceae cyanobacterium CP_BM_ER_R8_30]